MMKADECVRRYVVHLFSPSREDSMASTTTRKTEQSRRLQQRAESMIPGGVNSPVRAFRSVGGDPPFIVRGKGSHIWDADENEFIDYIGSWGPLILGHAEPNVLDAIVGAACNGTSFRGFDAVGGRSGGAGDWGVSACAESAVREFGDGSDDVGDPAGAGLYETKIYCEV